MSLNEKNNNKDEATCRTLQLPDRQKLIIR